MRIKRLKVKNFRQFKDEQTLDFPYSEEKSIVVIHGDNGAGKTSLLNAFKWALYGEVDFDTGDANIANDGALAEIADGDRVSVEVRLDFDDGNNKYYVCRKQMFRKEGSKAVRVAESELEVSAVGNDRETRLIDNPTATINQIMPQNLQGYFFFNGERIEKLAYSSRADDVKRAIKDLMGLTIIERAIKHLDWNARKVLRKDISGSQSEELRAVVEELDVKASAKEEKEKFWGELKKNVVESDKEIEDLNVILRNSDLVSELQEQRDSREDELSDCRNQEQQLRTRRKELISNKAFLGLGESVFAEAAELIEAERSKGHLPVKIRKTLVEDLLEKQRCLCDRSLQKDTAEYQVVASLLEELADQELEDQFFMLRSEATRAPIVAQEFFSELRDLEKHGEHISKRKKALETDLSEITAKIKGSDIEEIRRHEERRDQLKEIRDYNAGQIALARKEIADLSKEVDELDRKAENLRKAEKSGFVSQQRMDALNEIVDNFKVRYEWKTQEVRKNLSEMVANVFSKIITKPYRAEISEDFTLEVSKPISGGGFKRVEEKSTGENQVSSLSFIASLVAYLKKKNANDSSDADRGVFPLVMDSPFGALSPTYRRYVARYVPELADQIIIMVSESQWRDEVQEECASRVSASYQLIVDTDQGDVVSRISKD